MIDATRPEFVKFFPDDARLGDGAVVVMRRLPSTPTGVAPQGAVDDLLADAAWQTTVTLPARDGLHHEYVLGIVRPLTGEGCEY